MTYDDPTANRIPMEDNEMNVPTTPANNNFLLPRLSILKMFPWHIQNQEDPRPY